MKVSSLFAESYRYSEVESNKVARVIRTVGNVRQQAIVIKKIIFTFPSLCIEMVHRQNFPVPAQLYNNQTTNPTTNKGIKLSIKTYIA